VAAIAERLLAAFTASAPEVGFAFFNLDWERRLLNDDWCCHFVCPRLFD
jgi:hypothetical protein